MGEYGGHGPSELKGNRLSPRKEQEDSVLTALLPPSTSIDRADQETLDFRKKNDASTESDVKCEEKDLGIASRSEQLHSDSRRAQKKGRQDAMAENNQSLRNHQMHVFIMSWAGRPIYSYHHDETQVTSLMSVFTGLISFISLNNDEIEYLRAGETTFVFRMLGPIWLVCVCATGRPVELICKMLSMLHSQLLFVLTDRVNAHLSARPQLDIRRFLEGNDKYMDSLVRWMAKEFAPTLDCVQPRALQPEVRKSMWELLQTKSSEDMLYLLVIARGRLVQLVNRQPRAGTLKPVDIQLLIHFIQCTEAFRYGESICPICLPAHDSHNYLNLYIASLNCDVNLVILSNMATKYDDTLLAKERRLFKTLKSSKLLDHLEYASSQDYDVKEVCVPGLYHFLLKFPHLAQMTMPRFSAPYHIKGEQKRLKRLYQHCIEKFKGERGNYGTFCVSTEYELMVSRITAEFELYAIFSAIESKKTCVQKLGIVIKWVFSASKTLFMKPLNG